LQVQHHIRVARQKRNRHGGQRLIQRNRPDVREGPGLETAEKADRDFSTPNLLTA
jgi:hypothetical protein